MIYWFLGAPKGVRSLCDVPALSRRPSCVGPSPLCFPAAPPRPTAQAGTETFLQHCLKPPLLRIQTGRAPPPPPPPPPLPPRVASRSGASKPRPGRRRRLCAKLAQRQALPGCACSPGAGCHLWPRLQHALILADDPLISVPRQMELAASTHRCSPEADPAIHCPHAATCRSIRQRLPRPVGVACAAVTGRPGQRLLAGSHAVAACFP
jgi:hypothetical protein